MKKLLISLSFTLLIIGLFFVGYYSGHFIFPKKTTIISAQNSATLLANSNHTINQFSVCTPQTIFANNSDSSFCSQIPKLTQSRGIELDLTAQKALLFENNKLIKTLPVAYQSPENVWFETPTGYYQVGVKHQQHKSSLFPVQMPSAVQLYEDFFMHEIPYYDDGTRVSSKFSGGCIRFNTETAKEVFNFAQKNDQIIVYKTFDDLKIKPNLVPPVDIKNYWIRQRFNNPLRMFWTSHGDLKNIGNDYYQHTGVDFSPNPNVNDLDVKAIYDGTISKIQRNDGITDHGMGNTVIINHLIDGNHIYSLYAHLASIDTNIKEGEQIKQGDKIGTVGNTGYGCNFWKIGKDGCDSPDPNDNHLHFEIKNAPILENPIGGSICTDLKNKIGPCWGYVPDDPIKFGYKNPIKFLFDPIVANTNQKS